MPDSVQERLSIAAETIVYLTVKRAARGRYKVLATVWNAGTKETWERVVYDRLTLDETMDVLCATVATAWDRPDV